MHVGRYSVGCLRSTSLLHPRIRSPDKVVQRRSSRQLTKKRASIAPCLINDAPIQESVRPRGLQIRRLRGRHLLVLARQLLLRPHWQVRARVQGTLVDLCHRRYLHPQHAEVKDSYPHAVLGVFYDPAGGSKLHTEAVASAAISKARAAIFSMPDYLGAMQKLVLYHRNKFNDSSYEALAELIAADFCAFLTALPAGDTDSKYLAHVLAAADGELGRIILEAVRAAVRRSFPDVADAHFGRFILTQSDLIPGQGAGIVGVDDNGLPIGIDLGSQNMVVARHCFYTSLLGSQTLRAAARIAKPGGILAIVALRRQIACIARFLVPALNAGSLVSTGISYLSLTPTRKLMPNKELMKLTFTVTGAALPTETVETALGIGSSIASEDPGVALAKRALYAGYRQFCAIREMEAELGVKTSKHASPNAALDSVAAAELLYLVDPDCKPDDHVTAFAQKHGIYVVLAYLILCATSYTDVFQGALVFTTRREAESRAGAGGAAVLSALARLPHKVTEMLGPGCDVELATNDAEHSGPGVYAVEKDEGVKAVGVGVDAAKRSKEQRRAGGRSIYPVRFLPSIYSNSQCSRFLSEALETLLVVMFACLLPGDMIASPATTGGFDAETGGTCWRRCSSLAKVSRPNSNLQD